MANDPKIDPKNDQSVMISFDELDDIGPPEGADHEGSPQDSLTALGINKTTTGQRPSPMPIHAPVQKLDIKEPKSNALLYTLIALSGVGLVVGGVLLGQMLTPTNNTTAPTVPVAEAPPPSDAVKALLASEQPKEVPQEAPRAEPQEEPKADVKAEPKAKRPTQRAARSTSKRASSKRSAKRAQPKPEPQPAPKAEPKAKASNEASSLLSSLKKPKRDTSSASKRNAGSTGSNLPARLGRSEILSTVRKNQSGINHCKGQLKSGDSRVRVQVRLKIEKSGQVSSVEFLSPDAYKGTNLERCMKARVSRFKFPAFSGIPMSIKLPFIL